MKSTLFTLALSVLVILASSASFADAIYRVDSNPYTHLTVDGKGKKSHIDLKSGELRPANIQGHISIVDHIARSRIRTLKDNSQFTSFSTLDSLGSYYGGGYKITIDTDRLNSDIQSRKIHGVKIHSTQNIIEGIKKEMAGLLKFSNLRRSSLRAFDFDMNEHLKKYYAMVRKENKPTAECDAFFWKGIAEFRGKYPEIFGRLSEEDYVSYTYLANALRHVRTDHEVLVEGIIPPEYFEVEQPEQADLVSALKGIELAFNKNALAACSF